MKRPYIIFSLIVVSVVAIFATSCKKEDNENDTPITANGAFFSVSENSKVCFAPSNLTFTDANYSFALYQYNDGGYFGWGTGNNPGLTSTNENDYQHFYDWGYYIEGGYRTLTADEWMFLLYYRNNSLTKIGTGCVNGKPGLIILPDNWTLPDGCIFNDGFGADENDWSKNTYSIAQWQRMESAGAVFLSAAGCRIGTSVNDVDQYGAYWTSSVYFDTTAQTGYPAQYLLFRGDYVGWGAHYAYDWDQSSNDRAYGRSVRLARDIVD